MSPTSNTSALSFDEHVNTVLDLIADDRPRAPAVPPPRRHLRLVHPSHATGTRHDNGEAHR